MFGFVSQHQKLSTDVFIEARGDGWYLCSEQHKELFAGPFITSTEAQASYNSFLENEYAQLLKLGYVGSNVKLFGPLIATSPERVWIGDHTRIDSFVKLEGGQALRIGRYVHIASFSHMGVGGGVTILEDETGFSSGSKVVSGSNMPNAISHSIVAPQHKIVVERSRTVVKEGGILYAGATILPGVVVGKHSCVGAGSVVLTDVQIPDWEIWAGVPAKKIGAVTP